MTMPTFLPRASALRLAAAFALLSLAACAQSRDTAPNRGGRDDGARVEQMLTSLSEAVDLTGDQATRIRAILTAQQADRPSGPPPRGEGGGDRRAAMEAQRAATDRQIEAVLTEAQVESYRTWRAAQRPDGPPRRGR